MVSESKTVAKLLDPFSTEGLEKAKHLISNWEYVYPGQKEVLLKDGPKKTDRTRIRICKYKDEHILVKGPMESEMSDWLVNNFKAKKTSKSVSIYRIPLERLSFDDLDSIIKKVKSQTS